MKKLLLTTLTAITLLSSSSFATETTTIVSDKVKNNFRYDFKNIDDVKWTVGSSFITASFKLDNKEVQAFYDFDGNYIGKVLAVAVDNLPLNVKRVLAKRYKDYLITETISFDNYDEMSYFISLSNTKESVMLKVKDGQVSFYQKLR